LAQAIGSRSQVYGPHSATRSLPPHGESMARSAAFGRSAMRLSSVLLAATFVVVALQVVGTAFLPSAQPAPRSAAALAAAVTALGAAAPVALAEGTAAAAAPTGFLNFGKVELGGGFAINLDIPETGVVNIAVLVAGLVYLLGPLLSESMATREKEIQTDIDDAIAKFEEASTRLAEAEKAKAQANEVIAEIQASIEKDKKEFDDTIKKNTEKTLVKQAAASEKALAELQASAGARVEGFIQENAIRAGYMELKNLTEAQKAKFMDAAIDAL